MATCHWGLLLCAIEGGREGGRERAREGERERGREGQGRDGGGTQLLLTHLVHVATWQRRSRRALIRHELHDCLEMPQSDLNSPPTNLGTTRLCEQ